MISQKVSWAVTPANARGQTLSPRKRGTIKENLDSRFHGKPWIPAFAGMTNS